MKTNENSAHLHIWIAENGNREAKELICKTAGIDHSTLFRILKGTTPRFETRYHIYKITGIKLVPEDNYPETRAS